jgi:hypothetical protein
VILLALFLTLVPGTASTYTDGTYIWAGNPFCAEAGVLPSASSPVIDAGELISGLHCPLPGSAINQARLADGSYCVEWYGSAPDIGACEFVPAPPAAPSDLMAVTSS